MGKPITTIKHISSKNADYGAAEQYLTFEHDEFTMKPILDENGRLIPRTDYRMETLNCGNEDFALSCIRANMKYSKNNQREDIKSHHYIISFDPRDSTDNGLTVDRAQDLGLPTVRSISPDIRRLSAPTRAGLYQIDLLSGSKNKVTEREYWAGKQGQRQLDKEIAAAAATGTALSKAKSFEEFSAVLMHEYGIEAKENRGRYSYLTPERTKPITTRKLGTDFDKTAALAEAAAAFDTAGNSLKELERQISGNRELIRQITAYRQTKPAHDGLKTARKPEPYREQHRSDLACFEAAVRYFKEQGLKKMPAVPKLQADNEALISEKNAIYGTYREQKGAGTWQITGNITT